VFTILVIISERFNVALSNKVAARTTRTQRRIMCACGKQKKTLNDYCPGTSVGIRKPLDIVWRLEVTDWRCRSFVRWQLISQVVQSSKHLIAHC